MSHPLLYLRVNTLCTDSFPFFAFFYTMLALVTNAEIANTALSISVVDLSVALAGLPNVLQPGGSDTTLPISAQQTSCAARTNFSACGAWV